MAANIQIDVLKKHAAQFKLSKDAGGEYYKLLFSKHPEVAEAYGADGIDPDSIPHSNRFVMMAMNELQFFMHLPTGYGEERPWRSALSNFKEHYGDADVSLKEFNKTTSSLLATMAKYAGGVSAEQKKNWEALIGKAYADMKQWGWF